MFLSKERILDSIRRWTCEYNYKKIAKQITLSVLVIGIGSATPIQSTMALNEPAKTEVSVNLASANIFENTDRISKIVLGESVFEREKRLALERVLAEEKARVEVETKARAEEQTRLALAVRSTISRGVRTYIDPSDFDSIYAAAGVRFDVDAKLLKAIHIIETGASGSTARSNASGATGPMQFLPSTFRRHAVDGNGDGILDVHNLEDSIFSAAQYLRACGYPDLKKALWGYNPSTRYYNKVMRIYASL